MYSFTETVLVAAPHQRVWEVMRDIEGWWPDSNPDHESLELLDPGPVTRVGARLRIVEKIAGVRGVAEGVITRVDPMSAVTWEASDARYRLFGLSLTVGEGVTWQLEPRGDDQTVVGAHVWARLPSGLVGGLAGWFFRTVLNGVEKDREHARRELRYLKELVEHGRAR